MKSKFGLALTGGGARGAYQAGVLAGVYEILEDQQKPNPFKIITGSSAGAINACVLADILSKENDPSYYLESLWKNISTDNIFKTDALSLTGNGLNWLKTLALGGFGKPTHKILSLLDTSPLKDFLHQNINFIRIKEAIDRKDLNALAVSAVNYTTGTSRTSYMSHQNAKDWKREKREGVKTDLTINHVMASSAIPLLFPPVNVDGCYYGDGSLRDYTPLSPSIKLGARKLLVIGVRKRMEHKDDYCAFPTPARIFSMVLNGILLDAVDLDYERAQRINHTLKKLPEGKTEELKQVEILMITPSQSLGKIAQEEAEDLRQLLKYYLRALGNIDDAADIISYIHFEKSYTARLFDLGKKDLFAKKKELLKFLEE